MTMPTQKQIDKEIKKSIEMKPNIVHFSMFGDDNWEQIEAQIRVLEDHISEDEVYNQFDLEDAGAEDPQVSSALEAAQWLFGHTKEAPSEGWKSLIVASVKRKK